MSDLNFMYNLPIDSTVYWLFTFHCFIGGVAAVIAKSKGRNLILWLLLGLLGGTFAFVFALFLKSNKN